MLNANTAGATLAAAADATMPRRTMKRPTIGTTFAVTFLVVLGFITFLADKLPFVRSIDQVVKIKKRSQANFKLGPSWTAWFGTDIAGKDVFAKCMYGGRVTLLIGIVSTILGLLVGGLLGIVAGYFKGKVDRVIMILTDCLLSLPPLVLAILVVRRLKGEGSTQPWQIVVVLSILAIAPLTRIVRAQTMSLAEREYVLAARSVGAKSARVLIKEILPNLVPTMVSVAFTGLAVLIAAEGGLAFLGLGVESTPTWGKLIQLNYLKLNKAWWPAIFPCVLMFGTVLSFNILGDRIARRFDIREAAL